VTPSDLLPPGQIPSYATDDRPNNDGDNDDDDDIRAGKM